MYVLSLNYQTIAKLYVCQFGLSGVDFYLSINIEHVFPLKLLKIHVVLRKCTFLTATFGVLQVSVFRCENYEVLRLLGPLVVDK